MTRRTLRDWSLYWAGTLLFLVWDYCKRVRGQWRRGEWQNLRRHGCAIGVALLYLIGGFAIVGGLCELVFQLRLIK